ncbi:protein mcbE [Sodalis sp. RH15]|uniref:protein mcbE n=1 Tax=Sodalis sp. RH15 TaxID=3394330 RepID=UPI0039B6A20D
MNFFKMSFIFLKEQLRAPFSVIWTIASPVVLFFFLHFDDIDRHSGDKIWLRSQVSWFVGYISFSVILFSYCLYLNGRRESGFIATFVHDTYSKCLFILSQLCASVIMSFVYVIFFLLIVYTGFRVSINSDIFLLTLKSSAISLILMFSFTWLASLPVTFQTANVIFSVMVTVFMVFGIISFRVDEGIVHVVNSVNPVLIYSSMLNEHNPMNMVSGFFYGVMFLASIISLSRFRTEPAWSSQ